MAPKAQMLKQKLHGRNAGVAAPCWWLHGVILCYTIRSYPIYWGLSWIITYYHNPLGESHFSGDDLWLVWIQLERPHQFLAYGKLPISFRNSKGKCMPIRSWYVMVKIDRAPFQKDGWKNPLRKITAILLWVARQGSTNEVMEEARRASRISHPSIRVIGDGLWRRGCMGLLLIYHIKATHFT